MSGGSGDLQSMKLQPAPPGVKLFENGWSKPNGLKTAVFLNRFWGSRRK
jgi:hypothetical protein